MKLLKATLLTSCVFFSTGCDKKSEYDQAFLKDLAETARMPEPEILQAMKIKSQSMNGTINQAMWETCKDLKFSDSKKTIDCNRVLNK